MSLPPALDPSATAQLPGAAPAPTAAAPAGARSRARAVLRRGVSAALREDLARLERLDERLGRCEALLAALSEEQGQAALRDRRLAAVEAELTSLRQHLDQEGPHVPPA